MTCSSSLRIAVLSCLLLMLSSCAEEVSEFGLVVNPAGAALNDDQLRSNEHALSGLEVAPGLEATLFASEPMIVNPTNMAIDDKGRVWVCEGINYRPQLNPQNPVREEPERIIILEDEDGDGVADKRTVFYEGTDINSALGIWVMGQQAIVSVSPNIFLLTDEDGDDVADKKEVLYTGIGGEQHDHGVHAFVFGPDGRFYFNVGNSSGQVLDADGNVVIDMTGRPVVTDGNPYRQGLVFRVNPDGSDFEVLGHNFRNNYEVAVDSYGTLWQSDNDDDGNQATRINFVMEFGNYGFRDEMTGANWRARRTGMHDEIPKRHWHLNDPGVVPNVLQTGAGSPTGMAIYEGDLLPAQFHGQMLHTDAGPNVLRSYPVKDDGAGYSAEIVNIMKGIYDQWFRPSDVAVAPDGSILVADWYDPGVGGHQVGDLEKGRIFRLAPPRANYDIPAFDYTTAEGAVDALNNPNLAARYHAWMALKEMGATAEPALLSNWNGEDPRARARALWLLGRMEGVSQGYVDQALSDPDPNIRITGLRLARQLKLELIPILEKLVNDPSPQVRREVAVALRLNNSPEAPSLWAELASQYDGNDRWYLEALGIGAEEQWDTFFAEWKKQNMENWDTPAAKNIVWRSRSSEAIPMLASLIKSPSTTEADRKRYFRAFDFHTNEEAKVKELDGILAMGNLDISVLAIEHLVGNTMGPDVQAEVYAILNQVEGTEAYLNIVERLELKDQEEQLYALAFAEDSDLAVRSAGLLVNLNGLEKFSDVIQNGSGEDAMQAINLLRGVNSGPVWEAVTALVMNPDTDLELRKYTLSQFGPGWNGERRILAMLEEGAFPNELKETAASIMYVSNNEGRRAKAAEYLDMPSLSGGEPLPPVQEMIAKDGDPARGQEVFAQRCSICHVVNGEGVDYGPALSEIGGKLSREAMYTSILYPSAGVGFGYEGYMLEMNDGTQAVGYVLSRNDDEIQLREAGGQTRTYETNQLKTLEKMDQSLMPALGSAMDEQQLIDLVSYLESLVSM
ncbi:MAG: c-type cytochrome [Rhodothermaceae bacterium]|nr:c-type cytochrome [Rhodothermaceae bacterium]